MKVKISNNRPLSNTKVRIVPKTKDTILDVSEVTTSDNISIGEGGQLGLHLAALQTGFNNCKIGVVGYVFDSDWLYVDNVYYRIIVDGVDTGVTFGYNDGYIEYLEEVLNHATNYTVSCGQNNGLWFHNADEKQHIIEFVPSTVINLNQVKNERNLYVITDEILNTHGTDTYYGFWAGNAFSNPGNWDDVYDPETGRFIFCLAPYDVGITGFSVNGGGSYAAKAGDTFGIEVYTGNSKMEQSNIFIEVNSDVSLSTHIDSFSGDYAYIVVTLEEDITENINAYITVKYTYKDGREYSGEVGYTFYIPYTPVISLKIDETILTSTPYYLDEVLTVETDPPGNTIYNGSWNVGGTAGLYTDRTRGKYIQSSVGLSTIKYSGYDANWNVITSNEVTVSAVTVGWGDGNVYSADEGSYHEFFINLVTADGNVPFVDQYQLNFTDSGGNVIADSVLEYHGYNPETGKHKVYFPYGTATSNRVYYFYLTLTDTNGNKSISSDYCYFTVMYVSPTVTIGADAPFADGVYVIPDDVETVRMKGRAVKVNPVGRHNVVRYTNTLKEVIDQPITFDEAGNWEADVPVSAFFDGNTTVTVRSMDTAEATSGYTQSTVLRFHKPMILEVQGPTSFLATGGPSLGSGNYLIDWDDGAGYVRLNSSNAFKELTEDKLYIIRVRGIGDNSSNNNNNYTFKAYEAEYAGTNIVNKQGTALRRVVSFGNFGNGVEFHSCGGLVSVPDNIPHSYTTLSNMFRTCLKINDPNISNWDTSRITVMSYMFQDAAEFNQPLNWDFSNVTTATSMFVSAKAFNQSLEYTNWSSLTSAGTIFYGTNPDVIYDMSTWCVPAITAANAAAMVASTPNAIAPIAGTCPVRPTA